MSTQELDRLSRIETMLQQVLTAIMGTVGGDPGINHHLADHAARIARLEAVLRWVAGIGTAAITAIVCASALALVAIGGKH